MFDLCIANIKVDNYNIAKDATLSSAMTPLQTTDIYLPNEGKYFISHLHKWHPVPVFVHREIRLGH